MTNQTPLDAVHKSFADITAKLEDAALIASEAQSVPDLAKARKVCNRLRGQLTATRRHIDRLIRLIQ